MKRILLLAAATRGDCSSTAAAPVAAQRWNNARTVGGRSASPPSRAATMTRSGVPGTARYHQLRVCVFNGPDPDARRRCPLPQRRPAGHRHPSLMRAGTCTRKLDLRGNFRDVTAVRLKYAPLARGWVRPVVRVQAR